MPAYKFEYEEYLEDCHGCGMVFRHIKSGARVAVISNADDNKTFSIGFRTTPTNDTGVAHITEHSVLCGSDKFPVKDPFMELCKCSLNTFLNAFTYPDKTCYPVCSCNDKDFANLMDVYMDAVLHPNIYKHEEIFKQEGWHYELESKDDPITINGIVYSEMKGAFSTPEDILSRKIFSALYPDTTYGCESGGDPKAIPELTYKEFLQFHASYYHPSNSYIYLYGDMDVEERLNWLDSEYLCNYDYQPVESEVMLQEPVGVVDMEEEYPLGEEEPEENASFLSWACTVGRNDEEFEISALSVITSVLFNNQGAPIKEALIKAGVGQDISCQLDDELLQPYISVTASRTDASKMDLFKQILQDELKKAADEGLNKESLLAVVNRREFKYREADFGYLPKGLYYGMNVAGTWLYDDSKAFLGLHNDVLFPRLREAIETGYYEQLIRERLLSPESSVYFTLKPARGLGAAEEQALADRLAEMKSGMSDEELDELIASTAELKEYQAQESTPEELATIPTLTRADIKPDAEWTDSQHRDISGIPVCYQDIETNGIVYMDWFFDLNVIPEDMIPYVGILNKLLGGMNTEKYSYLEYNNVCDIYTGGIGSDIEVYSVADEDDSYRPMFRLYGSALEGGVEKLTELMTEVLTTDFSMHDRIAELLAESRTRIQHYMIMSGHSVGIKRATSHVSSGGRFAELCQGLDYYRKMCELLEGGEDAMADIEKRLREILELLIKKDNLTVHIACPSDIYDRIITVVSKAVGRFKGAPDVNLSSRRGYALDYKPVNEAFKISGDVNYVVMLGKYEKPDNFDSGVMLLVQQILSTDYLWNRLRVLGGAYGGGFLPRTARGEGMFYSYRDPNLADTMQVFKETAKYLREFDGDEEKMTGYIIGTVGGQDAPTTPSIKASRAFEYYISHITQKDIRERRKGLLEAEANDIHRVAAWFDSMASDAVWCTVGNENAINRSSELFDEISNLV